MEASERDAYEAILLVSIFLAVQRKIKYNCSPNVIHRLHQVKFSSPRFLFSPEKFRMQQNKFLMKFFCNLHIYIIFYVFVTVRKNKKKSKLNY